MTALFFSYLQAIVIVFGAFLLLKRFCTYAERESKGVLPPAITVSSLPIIIFVIIVSGWVQALAAAMTKMLTLPQISK